MNEEKSSPKESPEEKQINLELKKAQANKINAEAKKIQTEAEVLSNQKKKQVIDIQKIEVDLQKQKVLLQKEELALEQSKVEYELKKIQLDDKLDFINRKEASDERNFLYRFNDKVSKDTVRHCMETLTEWHRLDSECAIEIIFSSPGGSIIDGFELFDFL